MKLLTITILLLSLISCGKRVTNNSSGVQEVNRTYFQCSANQLTNNCTYQAVNYRLTPRDFYARYCYREYLNCLRQGGL